RAGHKDVDLPLAVVSVLPVERFKSVEERFARRFDLRSQFSHQHACGSAVLIADVLSDEKAMRLFGAKDEFVGSGGVDLLSDPFEADVDIVERADAVTSADAAH